MQIFLFLFLALDMFSSAQAAESCPFCPPAYCQSAELATRLKADKKQAAEARGLPKRLSVLFDQLGDCQACVETAPDWPHLVVEYDGDALSDFYGRDIEPYTTSRAWSAANEYRARNDMSAGLVSRFHITLGSEPCVCCKARDVDEYRAWTRLVSPERLLEDPKWNDRLRTYETQTVSVTSLDDAQNIPSDLSDIPPNLQQKEPSPGRLSDFRTAPPARVVQVLCADCQPLADLYNQQGLEINKTNDTLASLQRDLSYEQNMADYSRAMIDSLNAVAGTSSVIADQKSHASRMQQALGNMKSLQSRVNQLTETLGRQRSEQVQQMSKLRDCESNQCLPKDDNPPRLDLPKVAILVPATDALRTPTEAAVINWPDDTETESTPTADLPPLEVFWIGEILFGHPVDAECPASAGEVYLASNNGHPLSVSPMEEKGKISEFLDHSVSGNDTPTPTIASVYNCEAKKPRKLKGSVSTTVTDTVTGESVDITLPANGQITKTPKFSSDPNTEFTKWDRQGNAIGPRWKPIETNCPSCSKIVAQYNQTMFRVFKARRSVVVLRYWLDKFRKPGRLDWNSANADHVASYIARIEGFEQLLAEHKAMQLELEQQASYLQSVIRDCEQQQCDKKDRTKLELIDVPGIDKKNYFRPDTAAILGEHTFNWDGPYTSECLPCKPHVDQLNAIPGWLTRAHHKIAWYEHEIRNWEMQATTVGGSLLIDDSKRKIPELQQTIAELKNEISGLRNLMRDLQAKLALCQKKYCGKDSSGKPRLAMPSAIIGGKALLVDGYSRCVAKTPADSITIGPNNEVGSGAKFKEDATNKAVGAAVGALAGLAGFGGGGGGAEQGPPTYKDPIKNRSKTKVKTKDPKREIRVGAGFTNEGLLVSSDIRSAPGKGTFHSAVLQNDRGWQLLPWKLYLYEIWGEWNLSVSWTRDTFVDGELVKHEEGGWNESWTELIAKGESVNYVEIQQEPLWKRLGFNTATSGARSLGTLFPVSPSMLANEPLELFVHLSDPKKDPVVTVPYHFKLSLDDKGKVITEHIDGEAEIHPEACSYREFPRMGKPPDGNIVGEAVTTPNTGDYAFTPSDVETPADEIVFDVNGQRIVAAPPVSTFPPKASADMGREPQIRTPPTSNTGDSPAEKQSSQQTKPELLSLEDDDVMDEKKVRAILKDPSKFGRKLTKQEIEKLKTKPSEWDRDGDGIQNEADTMPDVPSDSFIAGTTIGRVLNPAGQAVKIFGSNGGGVPMDASDGVSVEVGNAEDGGSPLVEILGVELELEPGTILEASFG